MSNEPIRLDKDELFSPKVEAYLERTGGPAPCGSGD